MESVTQSRFNWFGSPQKEALRYLYVWIYDTEDIETQQGILPDQKVVEWLALTGEYGIPQRSQQMKSVTSGLRLLFCPLQGTPFQLGVSRQIYQHLQSALSLHTSTKEAILNNNGAYGSFHDAGLHEQDKSIPMRFILKVPNCVNIGYDAISLSYDPSTGITSGLIHGSSMENWDRITDFVRSSLPLCSHPFLVPAVLFHEHLKNTEQYRARIDRNLYQMEREIGYAIPGRLTGELAASQMRIAPRQDLHLEAVVRRLHSINTELITLGHVARFRIECSEYIMKTVQELNDKSTGTSNNVLLEQGERILKQLEYQRNASSCLLSQGQNLKERVQSHINLTFSLIAQEENRNSRSVAVDSALIAVASRRDSSAMKTIAIISTLFLPATFVATFFSMTFFNWGSSSGSPPTISPYIWVYWAISIPLTAVVYITWRIWWTLEEQKYRKEVAAARERHERSFGIATSYPTTTYEGDSETGIHTRDPQSSSFHHMKQLFSWIRGVFKRDGGRDKEFKDA